LGSEAPAEGALARETPSTLAVGCQARREFPLPVPRRPDEHIIAGANLYGPVQPSADFDDMQGEHTDEDADKRALGEALRELRTRAGLTQEQLAEVAGADPTYLSQLEKGRRDTRWTTITRLLRALNATVVDLGAMIERQRKTL
jgi:DNA-binding XRE family transcriptional regulator